jgi:hypothetical protein
METARPSQTSVQSYYPKLCKEQEVSLDGRECCFWFDELLQKVFTKLEVLSPSLQNLSTSPNDFVYCSGIYADFDM